MTTGTEDEIEKIDKIEKRKKRIALLEQQREDLGKCSVCEVISVTVMILGSSIFIIVMIFLFTIYTSDDINLD